MRQRRGSQLRPWNQSRTGLVVEIDAAVGGNALRGQHWLRQPMSSDASRVSASQGGGDLEGDGDHLKSNTGGPPSILCSWLARWMPAFMLRIRMHLATNHVAATLGAIGG
jgi:hypothetical protein